MHPFTNLLKVKAKAYNDEIIICGSIRMWLDTSYEKMKHAVTEGVIAGLPLDLEFDRESQSTIDYDTENELQVGDKIIFHYLTLVNCFKNGMYEKVGDEYFFYVKYDTVFIAVRGDEVVAVNGWLIVEPVKDKDITTTLFIPDHLKNKTSITEGVVRYAGTPLKGYLWDDDYIKSGDLDVIKTGMTVAFPWQNSIPLQYSLHAKLDNGKEYYRIQRRDIIAYEV